MKYDIKISGEFINIPSICIEKRIPLKISCTSCHLKYPNTITLSASTEEHNKYHEKGNLIVHCKNCNGEMKLSLFAGESTDSKYFISENKDGEFLIAKIVAEECLIEEIPLYEFYIHDGKDVVPVIIENRQFSFMEKDESIRAISDYEINFNYK